MGPRPEDETPWAPVEDAESTAKWEPTMLRERFTEEVVDDWLNDPKLAMRAAEQLCSESHFGASNRLPSIGASDRGTMRSTMGSRGLKTSMSDGIQTRVLTPARYSTEQRYPGSLPKTSPVTGSHGLGPLPPHSRAATALPSQHHVRSQSPIFPVDADPERFNVEFTGVNFVKTEFPSRRPVERSETIQLNHCLDQMLSDIASNENYGPSEKMNEDRKAHDIVAKELARQVSVHCMDQGLLIERCMTFYTEQVKSLPELFIQPLENQLKVKTGRIEDLEAEVEHWKQKFRMMEKRYKDAREAEALERKGRTEAERQLFETQQDLQVMTDKKDMLVRQLAKTEAQYKEERDTRLEREKQIAALREELAKLKDAHNKLIKQHEALQAKLTQTEGLLTDALDARQKAISMLDAEKMSRRVAEERADEAEAEVERLTAELAAAQAELDETKRELHKAQNEVVTLNRENDDLKARCKSQLTQLDELKEQLKTLSMQFNTCQDSLKKEQELCMKLKAENDTFAEAKAVLEAEVAEQNDTISTLRSDLDTTTKQLEDALRRLALVDDTIQDLRMRLAERSMTCVDLQSALTVEVTTRMHLQRELAQFEAKLKAALDEKEEEIDFLKIKIKRLAKEIEELDDKLMRAKEKLQVAEDRISALEEEMESLRETLARYEAQLEENEKKMMAMEAVIKNLEDTRDTLEATIADLQKQLAEAELRLEAMAKELEEARHKFNAEHFMRVALETRYKGLQARLREAQQQIEELLEEMAGMKESYEQQLVEEKAISQELRDELAALHKSFEEAKEKWEDEKDELVNNYEVEKMDLQKSCKDEAAAERLLLQQDYEAQIKALKDQIEAMTAAHGKAVEDLSYRSPTSEVMTHMTPPATPPQVSTQCDPPPPGGDTAGGDSHPTTPAEAETQTSKPPTPHAAGTQVSREVTPMITVTEDSMDLPAEPQTPPGDESEESEDPPEEVPQEELAESIFPGRPMSVWTAEDGEGMLDLPPHEMAPPGETPDATPRLEGLKRVEAEVEADPNGGAESTVSTARQSESVQSSRTSHSNATAQPAVEDAPPHDPHPAEPPRRRLAKDDPNQKRPVTLEEALKTLERCMRLGPLEQEAIVVIRKAIAALLEAREQGKPGSSRGGSRGATPSDSQSEQATQQEVVIADRHRPPSTWTEADKLGGVIPPVPEGAVLDDELGEALYELAGATKPVRSAIVELPRPGDCELQAAEEGQQWDVEEAVDYAADGLRIVAQSLHETSVAGGAGGDPADTLFKCLQTIVKASAEVREAQVRLRTPDASRPPTPIVAHWAHIDTPRLVPPGQYCPICRMHQPLPVKDEGQDDQLRRGESIDIFAKTQIVAEPTMRPSTAVNVTLETIEVAPQRPQTVQEGSAPAKPTTLGKPTTPTTEDAVGGHFDKWCKEKGVPELSVLQREGVMFILQSTQNRLMRAIDELQDDVTEVVSRFLPPDCDKLASVTGDELAKHLFSFKDQVRQCMSFESIQFFKAARNMKGNVKRRKQEFGQVAWLRCSGDHQVHVFMNDEDSIAKSAGSGLRCMFCN